MKPLKLTMQAFGSYAKKEEIHFDEIGKYGLFLISGKTGSGKSTIFDAIVYALFGEASGNERNSKMLRSSFANETDKTYVEFEFLYRNKKYLICRNFAYKTAVKRKTKRSLENGGLKEEPASVNLTLPDGSILSKTNEVDDKIREILGIDCNQFKQIVMIAQGEFRKILDADTKTRKEIFRNLFKTEKYAKLQEKIAEKSKQYQDGNRDALHKIQNLYQKVLLPEVQDAEDRENPAILRQNQWAEATKNAYVTPEILSLLSAFIQEDSASKCQIQAAMDRIDDALRTNAANQKTAQDRLTRIDERNKLLQKIEALKASCEAQRKARDEARQNDAHIKNLNDLIVLKKEKLVEYDKLEALQNEILSRTTALDGLRDDIQKTTASLDRDQSTLDRLKSELDGLKDAENALAQLKTTCLAHESRRDFLRQSHQNAEKLESQKKDIDALNRQIDEKTREREALDRENTKLHDERQTLDDIDLQIVKNDHERRDVESRKNAIASLLDDLIACQDAQKQCDAQSLAIAEKERVLQDAYDALKMREEQADRLKNIGERRQIHLAEKDKIQTRLDDLRDFQNAILDHDNTHRQWCDACEQAQAQSQKIDELNAQIDRIQRDCDELVDCDERQKQAQIALEETTSKRQKCRAFKERYASLLECKARLASEMTQYANSREALDKATADFLECDQKLRDDRAGFLAQQLKDGSPCPVCGALHHPNPAQKSHGAPSEDDVKAAHSLMETRRQENEQRAQSLAENRAKFASERDLFLRESSSLLGDFDFDDFDQTLENAQTQLEIESQQNALHCQHAIASCDTYRQRLDELERLRHERDDAKNAYQNTQVDVTKLAARLENGESQIQTFEQKTSIPAQPEHIESQIDELIKAAQTLDDELEHDRRDDDLRRELENALPKERESCENLKSERDLLKTQNAIETSQWRDKVSKFHKNFEALNLANSDASPQHRLQIELETQAHALDLLRQNAQALDRSKARKSELVQTILPALEAKMQSLEAEKNALETQKLKDEASRQTAISKLLDDVSSKLEIPVDEQNLIDPLQTALQCEASQIALCQAQIAHAQNQCERRQQAENDRSQLEPQIASQQNALHDKTQNYALAENDLKHLIENLETLQKQLDCHSRCEAQAQIEQIQAEADALKEAVETAERQLKMRENELAHSQSQEALLASQIAQCPAIALDPLKAEEATLKRDKSQFSAQKDEIVTRILTNQANRDDLQKISDQMGESRKIAAIYETLNAVANGQNGARIDLETWVQTIRFDHILANANTRFYEMTNHQFQLKRAESTTDARTTYGLDLNVKDINLDVERSAKSLSGGESFMASLSLALGLSDEIQATAGGIQLDSLFIDEGFGTLSPEARESAIQTLVDLKNQSHRTIGIISHVEELQNRIENQIIVEKSNDGGSQIRFKMNA